MSAPTKQRTDKEIAEELTVSVPVTYNLNHVAHVVESIRYQHQKEGFGAQTISNHMSFLGFDNITTPEFVQAVIDLL